MNPIIETERLVMRRPVEADFKCELDFWQSDRAEFVGGKKTADAVWRSFAMNEGHWAFRGYGFMSVIEKSTQNYIGHIGPWFPEGWPEREIGWVISNSEYEAQGYAFEAAMATRDYAYETLDWESAISVIEAANTRSIKLAKRMGAKDTGEKFDYKDADVVLDIYRHPSAKELS